MLTLLGGHDTRRVLTACRGDVDAAVLLYTLLLTMPGAPLIYYGDENGMLGENDPDCRKTMVWDESAWNYAVRNPLKTLLEVRHASPCLRRGTFKVVFSEDRVIAFERSWRDQEVLVVLNNSRAPRSVSFPVTYPAGTVLRDELCGDTYTVGGGELRFDAMTPQRAWILQKTL